MTANDNERVLFVAFVLIRVIRDIERRNLNGTHG